MSCYIIFNFDEISAVVSDLWTVYLVRALTDVTLVCEVSHKLINKSIFGKLDSLSESKFLLQSNHDGYILLKSAFTQI